MTDPLRVLVADDHDLVRDGLAAILDADPGIEVVGEVADGPAAVRAARELHPDIVLMDVEMPGGDGLTATRTILATCPTTRVLMLTMFDLDEYVYQALRAGASGFLLKTTPSAKLLDAVKSCAAGETLLAPSVVHRLITSYVQRPPAAPANQTIRATDGVDATRTRCAGRHRSRPVQRRDRRRAVPGRSHRQDPHHPHPGQTRPARSSPSRRLGLRERTRSPVDLRVPKSGPY